MTHKILIIDDEADIREVLSDIFMDEGYAVTKAAHSEQAFSIIQKETPDLIVLDIWLENSDMDGVEILKALKKKDNPHKDIPVLMISGHGNIEMAVKAMKLGAYDFIEKPFKIDHILLTVQRALEQRLLKQENLILKDKISASSDEWQTKSSQLLGVLKQIDENQQSEARSLIIGEVGTGKNRLTEYIHRHSARGHQQLESVHADELSAEKITSFFETPEYAQTSVLIKHVQLLPQNLQALLLKFLSSSNGNNTPRILCTATPNISSHVSEGLFSSALYDRLSVQTYVIPPLRERTEDMLALISDFSKKIGKTLNKNIPPFSSEALILLQGHTWKGNITQFKTAVEWLYLRHVLEHDDTTPIHAKDVMYTLGIEADLRITDSQSSQTIETNSYIESWLDVPLREARENFEKLYLSKLINRFCGNISQLAAHVDMERTALHRKLKSMDVKYSELTNRSTERKAG